VKRLAIVASEASPVMIVMVLAACGHHADRHKRDAAPRVVPTVIEAGIDAPPVAVALPPAPPIPEPPLGLPALPSSPQLAAITPDLVAFGALLFWDGRLSSTGTTSCASCHAPDHDFAGGVDKTAGGERNLRRTQALTNLAWATEYGWDGRFTTLPDFLRAHVKGQLGQESLVVAMTPLAGLPVYAAHVARIGGTPGDAALRALEAYALTRYEGNAPWDWMEHDDAAKGSAGSPVMAGYALFTGKAGCAVCHTPPLYTDHRYHAVGAPTTDVGRGKIDPKLAGAFVTPSLRGAALRTAFLHDGRATTLAQALDAHDDPSLAAIAKLTPDERDHVLAFVMALTGTHSPEVKPALP
jgi:cytochrome c peroxidase